VGVAEFVEIEKFRRQRFAARVSLTFVLIDANLQLSGHGGISPLWRAWLRVVSLFEASLHRSLCFIEVTLHGIRRRQPTGRRVAKL